MSNLSRNKKKLMRHDCRTSGGHELMLALGREPEARDERLLRALIQGKKARILFQPIISVENGEVFGYEALARGPVGSPLELPMSLFETAERAGLLFELEEMLMYRVLQSYEQVGAAYLFINRDHRTILDPRFYDSLLFDGFVSKQLDPRAIVIELTEHAKIPNYEQLTKVTQRLRKYGIRLAIDDAGVGWSGLYTIGQILPELIKVDMKMVHDAVFKIEMRTLLEAFIHLAKKMGILVVAEGIENKTQLKMVQELEFHFAQGFLLGEPHELMARG